MGHLYTYLLMAMEGLCSTWTFLLLCGLSIKLYQQGHDMNKCIVFLALSVLLCLCIASMIDTVLYSCNEWNILSPYVYDCLLMLYVAFWITGFNICAYLYFLSLIYYSFRGSFYAISIQTITLHIIIAAMVASSTTISMLLQEHQKYTQYAVIFVVFEVLLYNLGLCHMGYLLNKKLILLVILDDNPTATMNAAQVQLLKVNQYTLPPVVVVVYT